MLYIRINPESLELEVVSSKYGNAIYVPIHRHRIGSEFRDVLHYTVLFDVLYPIVQARDRKRDLSIKYRLYPPDPWLVALAAIMWQGLVQGLTWDVIKHFCLSALHKLRQDGLAPPAGATLKRRVKRTKTEIGFSWTQFSQDGRPLYQFFLKVKRRFANANSKERVELTKAKRIARKSNRLQRGCARARPGPRKLNR